ncbi:hypothetical protein HK405_001630, partial [Cladochytrium tenue]
YRDFGDGGKAAYPFKDFISNTVEFRDFLANTKATSVSASAAAFVHTLLMIGDAPNHGNTSSGAVSDDHLDRGTAADAESVFRELCSLKIKSFFIKINSSTDLMVRRFDEAIATVTAKNLKLDELVQALRAEHEKLRQTVGEDLIRSYDLSLMREVFQPHDVERCHQIVTAAATEASSTAFVAAAGAAPQPSARSATGAARKFELDLSSTAVGSTRTPGLAGPSAGSTSVAVRTRPVRSTTPPPAIKTLKICFMSDCTGSMGAVINTVKKEIKTILESVKASSGASYRTVKVAFVGYRDFGDENRIVCKPFTDDISAMEAFIDTVRADGGDDAAEDVVGGLHQATLLEWGARYNVLLHFADAPGHGTGWNCDLSDNYATDDAIGVATSRVARAGDYLRDLIGSKVYYHFIALDEPKYTYQTIGQIRDVYNAAGKGGRFKEKQLGDLQAENFSKRLVDEIVNSISMSIAHG